MQHHKPTQSQVIEIHFFKRPARMRMGMQLRLRALQLQRGHLHTSHIRRPQILDQSGPRHFPQPQRLLLSAQQSNDRHVHVRDLTTDMQPSMLALDRRGFGQLRSDKERPLYNDRQIQVQSMLRLGVR